MTSATRWPQSRCCIEACRPADQGATFSEDQGILLPSQRAYWFRSSELRARHSRATSGSQRLYREMKHEDSNRQEHIKPSSDRSFGLVIATFFLIITFWPLIHAEPVRWWALAVAAVFAVAALAWTAVLAPLNKLWTKLGMLLYRIVNPVVMALLFYVTVTPIALLMRLLGKDPLRLRRDPDAASYWIDRTPPGPAPQSMTNQF